MNVKDYLKQHRLLEQMITTDLEELKRVKELSVSVSAIAYDREYVQTTRNTNAPFEKWLNKLMDLEERIAEEVSLLMELKVQIRQMLEKLDNTHERLVLHYRYVEGLEWQEICKKLYATNRTVFRWHGNGLSHVKMPQNPINIRKLPVDGSEWH